jgi:protein Tex
MAEDLGVAIDDLISKEELRKKVDLKKYVTDKTGIPTLVDIIEELAKPGRDPRANIQVFEFSKMYSGSTILNPGWLCRE